MQYVARLDEQIVAGQIAEYRDEDGRAGSAQPHRRRNGAE
jgi:hypothetical protein